MRCSVILRRDGPRAMSERGPEEVGPGVSAYLPILTLIVLVGLFAAGSFLASSLLGPRRPTSAKEAPYECGIVPESEPAERFPVKFYLVAMAFIVLDVEIVFLYPFVTVMRELSVDGLILMGVFLLVLLVPFAYLLSTGALEWGPVKQVVSRAGAGVLRAAGDAGSVRPRPRGPEPARRRGTGGVDGSRAISSTTSSPGGSKTS